MRGNKYETAAALRQAITDRLKKIAKTEGVRANRLFRHLAFDRFLARLFHTEKHCWVLKGGYAMELRMQHSRETKDIDLAMLEMTSNMYAILTKVTSRYCHAYAQMRHSPCCKMQVDEGRASPAQTVPEAHRECRSGCASKGKVQVLGVASGFGNVG